ncbi:MAG: SDR family NAD(P)-dependent oxidoreductase, partial [Myxococcales bacterium]|nr:SDR family NAD(P)-dependent oxidoreductase [Myxococcales bacterium]
MKEFEGKIAVITGGSTGMGRELAMQLAGEGCHVAICDVVEDKMEATRAACEEAAPAGTRVTAHRCDTHHLHHRSAGGQHRLDNLVHLCRHHHRFVHEARWTTTGSPNG